MKRIYGTNTLYLSGASYQYFSNWILQSTHLPDEIDVTFALLDIWRTLWRNSVGRVSRPPCRRVENRRQEMNLQHIVSVLQQLSDWEVLHTRNTLLFTEKQNTCRKMLDVSHCVQKHTYLRNMLSVLPTATPLSWTDATVSTPSKVRRTFCCVLLTQRKNMWARIRRQKMVCSISCFLYIIQINQTHLTWSGTLKLVVYVQLSKAIHRYDKSLNLKYGSWEKSGGKKRFLNEYFIVILGFLCYYFFISNKW